MRFVLLAALLTTINPVAAQDTRPSHRVAPGTAYDVARGRLVMFGGVAFPDQEPLGETWEWDGRRWYLLTPALAPSARVGPVMAYDAGRRRVVLFGGMSDADHDELAETWEWDGAMWIRIAAPGPGPRIWHAMYFDAGRAQVMLLGGVGADEVPLDDVWAWDGSAWTRVLDVVEFDGVTPMQRTRERAYRAALRSDLRNLVTAQEVYFADHLTYAPSLAALGSLFSPSTDVTLTIMASSATGWSAVGVHERRPDARCGIFIGDATPPFPEVQNEGEPECVGFGA
jgi:hypothetical protein